MEKFSFKGYNIVPKFLKSDKSYRVEIDTSKDQNGNLAPILAGLPEGIYTITIEPDVREA